MQQVCMITPTHIQLRDSTSLLLEQLVAQSDASGPADSAGALALCRRFISALPVSNQSDDSPKLNPHFFFFPLL